MLLVAAGQLEPGADLQAAETTHNRDPSPAAKVAGGRVGLEDGDRIVVGVIDEEHLIERALNRLAQGLIRRTHSDVRVAEAEPT